MIEILGHHKESLV